MATETDTESALSMYIQDIDKNPRSRLPLSKLRQLACGKRIALSKAIIAWENSQEIPDQKKIIQAETKREIARSRLVESQLRWSLMTAYKYRGRGLTLLELVQEGNLGLIHAAEKYDYRKGFMFDTYATWWIRQYIVRAIANQGSTIRIPVHAVEDVSLINKTNTRLRQSLNREPTPKEIAAEAKRRITPEKVVGLGKRIQPTLSISNFVGHDEKSTFADLIEDKEINVAEEAIQGAHGRDIKEQFRKHLPEILNLLGISGRDLSIYYSYICNGRTLQNIGNEHKIGRERVRQIVATVESKLKGSFKTNNISDIENYKKAQRRLKKLKKYL